MIYDADARVKELRASGMGAWDIRRCIQRERIQAHLAAAQSWEDLKVVLQLMLDQDK